MLSVFASVQRFKPHLLMGINFLFVSNIGRFSRIWGAMKLRGPHRTPHEWAPFGPLRQRWLTENYNKCLSLACSLDIETEVKKILLPSPTPSEQYWHRYHAKHSTGHCVCLLNSTGRGRELRGCSAPRWEHQRFHGWNKGAGERN